MQFKFNTPLPLSLYVHYPWCVQKCPYCDFNSHTARDDLATQENRYIQAVIKQLETTLPWVWGREISSIFFGGGTPSLMSGEGFTQLMSQMRALLNFKPNIEITLEANPGAVDAEKFYAFYAAGANRISIGAQSFNNQHLEVLGRIHHSDEIHKAVEAAKSAGFKRINLDVMFGLPEQTLEEAVFDINQAIQADVEHISHYQLTIEPNTHFYKQPPVLPEMDNVWQMQEACEELLLEAGYKQYEISAYTRNQECHHNMNYWQFGDYLGLGAGAHGKITLPQTGEIWRTQMPASPGAFIEMLNKPNLDLTAKHGRWHTLDEQDAISEFMLNVLRLKNGFSLELFEQTTGLTKETIQPKLNEMLEKNWLEQTNNQITLTDLGNRFINNLMEEFI